MGSWFKSKDNTEVMSEIYKIKDEHRDHIAQLFSSSSKELKSEITNPILSDFTDLRRKIQQDNENSEFKFSSIILKLENFNSISEHRYNYLLQFEKRIIKYLLISFTTLTLLIILSRFI